MIEARIGELPPKAMDRKTLSSLGGKAVHGQPIPQKETAGLDSKAAHRARAIASHPTEVAEVIDEGVVEPEAAHSTTDGPARGCRLL